MNKVLLVAAFVFFSFGTAYAATPAGEPIKIGDINAWRKLGEMVQTYQKAAQLAVDEINARGGVLGRPLQLVSRDSKLDPGTGIKWAEELWRNEKVAVLMDCDSSATTLAVSAWAQKNKVPFINTSSEADSIMWDHGHPYVFRTAQGGHMWVSALLDLAVKRYGDAIKGKRWAIVAPNFEFGQSIVQTTKRLAEERGLKPVWVAEQWPTFDKMEAGATVMALQRAKPDVIFNLLFTTDLVKFVREGKKRGLFKDRIVIAPPVAIPDHIKMLGAEMPEGWLSTGFPADEITDPTFMSFKKAYEAAYHQPIQFYTPMGYIAVQAIAAAIEKAGSTEPEALRAALEAATFPTPYGKAHFLATDHQATVPFWIGVTTVENGHGKLEHSPVRWNSLSF